MEISKSTPYVRYRENISSSLHKGTVHIESEYLDRERKTTIESIEGQTWQNLVTNENKELEMLGVGSIGLSGDIYDTGEKRLAVDVVMGNATPTVNEDGTYTYSVSTMEGEYARTFDGVNHITSTSDGLDGEFHIKYNTQGEEIIGNFSMCGEESHVIEDGKNGEIKSAILRGQTLVNDIDLTNRVLTSGNTITSDGYITINANSGYSNAFVGYKKIKSNTKYLCIVDIKEFTANGEFNLTGINSQSIFNFHTTIPSKTMGIKKFIFTTRESIDETVNIYSFRSYLNSNSTEGYIKYRLMMIEYQDGMENWDIPHFEGMQTVKMPVLTTSQYPTKPIQDGLVCWLEASDIKNGDLMWKDKTNNNNNATLTGFTGDCFVDGYLKMKKGAKISLPTQLQYSTVQCVFAEDKINNYQIDIIGTTPRTMRFCMRSGDYYPYYTNIKDIAFNNTDSVLETGMSINTYVARTIDKNSDSNFLHLECSLDNELHQNTTIGCDTNSGAETKFKTILIYNRRLTKEERLYNYEYAHGIELGNKSNILTVNEDVELRGVGDVQDTLDCLTGEVVQNIGEMVLDGSESWQKYRTMSDGSHNFVCNKIDKSAKSYGKIISNNLPVRTNVASGVGLYLNNGGSMLELSFTDLSTVAEVKSYLNNNNATIQYQLATKSVKTVDLIIKDQDGKTSRQLSTYEGTTHVNVSSDGLTPLVDISYKMYSTTDVVSGTSVTIEDGKASDMVEGVVYGNSMVNLLDKTQLKGSTHTLEDNIVTMNGNGANYTMEVTFPRIATQPNKVYTLCNCYLTDNTTSASSSGYDVMYRFAEYNGLSYKREKTVKASDSDKLIVTIGTETTDICISLFVRNANGEAKFTVPMLIEGDYTDQDIPYFEGIGSVENPLVTVSNGNLWGQVRLSESWDDYSHDTYGTSLERILKLEPNTKYRINNILRVKGGQIVFNLLEKQANGSYRSLFSQNRTNRTDDVIEYTTNSALTTTTGDMYLQFYPCNSEANFKWGMETIKRSSLTIFKDGAYENNTMIEPESSHLSTTPRITLHGIGDVKDEWDVVNETVTRNLGKMKITKEMIETFSFEDGAFFSIPNSVWDGLPPRKIFTFGSSDYGMISNCMVPCIWNPSNPPQGKSFSQYKTGVMRVYSGGVTITANEWKQWFLDNEPEIVYELETPTTESVLITPQNPKTSTASITINEPLNTQDAIHDKLRWNPYKGCYVRYNHIVDGVAYNQHRTIENLYDLDERQCVDLYEHRTYFLPTNGSMESRTHGTSVYCLAEQGKQYCVRWDWIESPTVDTIKVDLCGNIKEIASTENSVVIDVANMKHSFVQLQGNGLQGKFTNLMVIETIDGEIPDVDFFSGVKAIGNTVQIDGATKVQIDVEQTNGNLFDIEPVIFNNGNYISYCWNENNRGMPIKNGKTYTFKHLKRQDGEWGDYSLRTFDENLKLIRTISIISGAKIREHSFTAQYNEKYIRGYGQMILNGSTHTHYPVELCYTDMIKDGIRPRHHDMKSFILPMKLCRVGEVYDELYYDDLKGYYRIQQSIGHKYFTGDTSERWEMGAINLNSRTVAFTYKNGDINQLAMGDTICNGFKHLKDVNQDTEGFIIYNGDFVLRIDKERIEGNCSIDGLRAYLSSYPIHLFYQLKTPQMVDLPQYPNRLELNTYRDEVFTFIKDSNPTKFTLSIPMDRTYRFEDHQEGQGLANRVSITDERISSENVVAIQEIRGKGIANLIEDPNNVPVTPLPNYSGVATSHQLTNTKPSIVHVHGFEPSGDTKIGTWNTTDKKYQIKVMSGNSNYSLSDYYVLDVPYQLETYPDGTKDRVYYNVERQEWQVNGSYDRTIAFNTSTGAFTEAVEIFRGMAPRSGMIAEFKLRFTSGTTTARLYYSVNGSTYSYVTLRGMVDDQDYYLAFFNTGGTKIDYSTKVGATTEYASMTALSATIPEGLFVNQIQSLTECTHYVDKFYQYPTLRTPIELDTYDGTTNIYIDGKTTDTNIIINNDCFQKVVNTYEDVEYTVYWKYLSGDGKLTITLGGTRVEVDGTKEYATIRTQLQAPQELVYIGGYNLSIQDVMVVKGARIDGLAYFEGSREVGTLVVDEHGNKQYKITLVQGGSVLEQKDYDKVEFKDDNKHNVVVHKIVGVRPTKVD